jgi:murein DD-endopeptidase MepM/ murein hydrolase activator NlpD
MLALLAGTALAGCAQTVEAPVVSGYQGTNQVAGISAENAKAAGQGGGFSLTREVSARAATPAPEITQPNDIKEENLGAISPAAGPQVAPARRSLIADYTENHVETQGVTTHKVEPGETVYRLARRYNTSPAEILKANHMDSTADLAAGQTLTIPAGSKNAAVTQVADGRPAVDARSVGGRSTADAAPMQGRSAADAPPKSQTVASAPQPTPAAGTRVGLYSVTDTPALAAKAHAKDETLARIEPAAGPKPAEVVAPAPQPREPQVHMVEHKVVAGETVYRIAHQYGASVLDVMGANNFTQPQDLKTGLIVKVPVKGADAKTAAVTAHLQQQVAGGEEDETARVNPPVSPTAVDEVKARLNKGRVDPVAAKARGMAWPVHGQILTRYGDLGNGVSHTGINIAVPLNTPVLAADAGEVVYAGSGLRTYGNLVLVRHGNGMVSAYAHNNMLLVKKGENVKKGQVIALSGATGNVARPQLHFELRRRAEAIDPMRLLASQ